MGNGLHAIFLGAILLSKVEINSLKTFINLLGPMKYFIIKRNHTSTSVSEILSYRQTHTPRQTDNLLLINQDCLIFLQTTDDVSIYLSNFEYGADLNNLLNLKHKTFTLKVFFFLANKTPVVFHLSERLSVCPSFCHSIVPLSICLFVCSV